jgi:uncharacterized protein (TIGR00255 family)
VSEVGVLLSMTGHGEARGQCDSLHVAVEIRSVNNRHLKLMLRAPEPYNLLEAEVEQVVRKQVRRGTLQVQLRVDRPYQAQDFRINETALRSYAEQVSAACEAMGVAGPATSELLGHLLALPGVAPEPGTAASTTEDDWPLIEKVLEEALGRLQSMRREEGRRMADELLRHQEVVAGELDAVRKRMPQVVAGYRDRLLERVRGLLADSGASAGPDDLIREVSVFAERSDIAEEVVRLASHLEQFEQTIRTDTDSPGRKLEFVVQEMGRETNTIGSKASDVAISRHVVEIKATLEKVRELIQNVE